MGPTSAAVLRELGTVFEVRDDVYVDDPEPGEVLVAIEASGVCGSDIAAMAARTTVVPTVIGHEAAGHVLAVGAGVSNVEPGDRVVIAYITPCGDCPECRAGQTGACRTYWSRQQADRLRVRRWADGLEIGKQGIGGYASHTLVPARAVVPVPDEMPMELAALVACGVMTGVGAALNTARVEAGSTVLVVGCGGVGVNVLQGARIAGAARIVAVDAVVEKREDARRFGATHVCGPEEAAAIVGELTDGVGVDTAIEATGRSDALRSAFDLTRRGGTTVVVGMGSEITLTARQLVTGHRRLLGSFYGGGEIRTEIARMIRLWQAGLLDLESLISDRMRLHDINDAFARLRSGTSLRIMLDCRGDRQE